MTNDQLKHEGTTETMARLSGECARASARIDQLDQESREAARALAAASDALVEFERHGGRTAARTKLEEALARAKGRAAEPWQERIEGARRAGRDTDAKRQRFVAEHLTELVEVLEGDGAVATRDLNEHAERVLQAFRERERIAGEVSALASMVGRVLPGDVSRSAAEQLAHAAAAFLERGGEIPPTLERDPRQPRHAEAVA